MNSSNFGIVEIPSPDRAKSAVFGRQDIPVLLCGPCVIESREHVLFMAESIAEVAAELGCSYIFKASYDKANRTSSAGYRGLGIERGLEILSEVRTKFNLPVVTDIHTEEEVALAAEVVDLLQVPAFLCRQTSLLEACGKTKKPVMIKKGQFLHPEDMKFAAEKVTLAGSPEVILCERGSCFGYRELVVDMRSLVMMRELGVPVVFDATHSVQIMGGAGGKSSGNSRFIPALLKAACAVGIDGVFLECHDRPESALSDGPNMVRLDDLKSVLSAAFKVWRASTELG